MLGGFRRKHPTFPDGDTAATSPDNAVKRTDVAAYEILKCITASP